MKWVRHTRDLWEWHLTRQEWSLLRSVFHSFPRVPPHHHNTAHPSPPESSSPADQTLLEESLASHRTELRRTVQRWLLTPVTASSHPRHVVLRLASTDLEHLLQVLNDIRVGCWIQLGCPGPGEIARSDLPKAEAQQFLTMEFCGLIQTQILAALDRPDDPPTE